MIDEQPTIDIKIELLAAVICGARDKTDEIVSMLGRDHSARLWEDVMALAAALYAAMENKEAKHD